jgi:hypothetical protein
MGDRVAAAASTTTATAGQGTMQAIFRQDPFAAAIQRKDGHTSILAPADGSIRISRRKPVAARR